MKVIATKERPASVRLHNSDYVNCLRCSTLGGFVRKRSLTRRLAIMSLPQGLTASKSVGRLRTFGVKNVKDVPLMNVRE